MKATLRSTVAAALLLLPAAASVVAQPAVAATAVQPRITNMALNSDAGLSPGATLRVQLYATPDARRASVTLGENGVTVPLRQQAAGNYTGSYIVRRTDRIDPTQLMTARVTVGDRTAVRQFNFPPGFQALAMSAAPEQTRLIERFVLRPTGRIEPGSELRFRLVGEPGGDAWMDIPGVILGVDLAEVRPGVYEGTYTVRRRDDPDAFRGATASLRAGSQRATARVDLREDREAVRDDHAPQITGLFPGNGDRVSERGRAQVGARLGDEGSGIDPASVRLRLNGRDVSAEARVTPDEVRYRGDLAPGHYAAEVSVRDRAGNTTTKSWSFDVAPGDRIGAAGPELPLHITSPANNMLVDANGHLALQGRTVPFANVHVHVDARADVAGVLGVNQPIADQAVQADGNGFFAVAVIPRGLAIPGMRYDVRVTASSGSQSAEERLTLIQRG